MLILDKRLAEECSMVPQSVYAFSSSTYWPEERLLTALSFLSIDEYYPLLKE
jgi:hypothetical protein